MLGSAVQIWEEKTTINSMRLEIPKPVQDRLIGDDGLRQQVASACLVAETLELKKGLRVQPSKQPSLPVHAAKFIDQGPHHPQSVALKALVVKQAEDRNRPASE